MRNEKYSNITIAHITLRTSEPTGRNKPELISVGPFYAKTKQGEPIVFGWLNSDVSYQFDTEGHKLIRVSLWNWNSECDVINRRAGVTTPLIPNIITSSDLVGIDYECYLNPRSNEPIKLELVSFKVFDPITEVETYFSREIIERFNSQYNIPPFEKDERTYADWLANEIIQRVKRRISTNRNHRFHNKTNKPNRYNKHNNQKI